MPDSTSSGTNTEWPGPLVSAEWLREHLGDERLIVLDIRSMESGGRAAFEAGHVPGAVHSDYAASGWRVAKGGAGGLLPEPDFLAGLFGQLGVTPGHHVVILSAGSTIGDFSPAARVYWTFKVAGHARVSILDGGYAAWTAAGGKVEKGAPARADAPLYPVRIDHGLRAQLSDVEQALARKEATLLDGRSRAQFEGLDKSAQAARAGRLPGAVHLDVSRAFDPGTARLRPSRELDELFSAIPAGPVVSYCNTGQLASTNWFILSEILKRQSVSLYDGSMSEWTQDPGHAVEVEPSNDEKSS
jgi:thiosulfate/3-mercaptopyruvate sulfurtransferase